MKKQNFTLWFLRLFSEFRKLEAGKANWVKYAEHCESNLEKLSKQAESDGPYIDSLNRYIKALEGKADVQAELIRELRERLGALLAR